MFLRHREWCEALSFRAPDPKMKGPTARGNLRPSSRFFRWVSATPAQTALLSTSPWKDFPKHVVKPGIRQTARRPWAKNWKLTRAKSTFFEKFWFFFQKCPEWSGMAPETPGMLQNMSKCFRMTDFELLRSSLSRHVKHRFFASKKLPKVKFEISFLGQFFPKVPRMIRNGSWNIGNA